MTVSERVGFTCGVIAIVLSVVGVLLAISRGLDATTLAASGTTAVIGALCIVWSRGSSRRDTGRDEG